jgi:hypothetical protein
MSKIPQQVLHSLPHGSLGAAADEEWLKAAKRGVFEQQPLLFARIGEEHADDSPRFDSQHHPFTKLGVENPVSRGKTRYRCLAAGSRAS